MIKRRLLAALVLFAFAIGSVLFWNDGEFDLFYLGVNLLLACVGLVFLHLKWKRREDRTVTPEKAKDIFS